MCVCMCVRMSIKYPPSNCSFANIIGCMGGFAAFINSDDGDMVLSCFIYLHIFSWSQRPGNKHFLFDMFSVWKGIGSFSICWYQLHLAVHWLFNFQHVIRFQHSSCQLTMMVSPKHITKLQLFNSNFTDNAMVMWCQYLFVQITQTWNNMAYLYTKNCHFTFPQSDYKTLLF